ncbi:MAG: PEP-CTERM sorting domain-containing protein [Burkholderiaceae bacterium]
MYHAFFKTRTALAAIAIVAALPAAQAADVTLDFSGNICGAAGNLACANYSEIGQNYGDIADVLDVSHRSVVAATGATHESFLKFWAANYSDLDGVAWGGADQTGYYSEMTFTAGAGQQVTLNGFDFGDYADRNYGSNASIFDLGGALLWSSGSFNPGVTSTHFAPSITSTSGLVLRWGPDGYDVGIDNIQLTVGNAVTAPVPEPETYALMLAGLVAIGAYARRRRAA